VAAVGKRAHSGLAFCIALPALKARVGVGEIKKTNRNTLHLMSGTREGVVFGELARSRFEVSVWRVKGSGSGMKKENR
jgi:hypothetical protein